MALHTELPIKHTPGQWNTQRNVVNYRSGRKALEVRGASDDLIATFPGCERDEANARLIAAAPDLLEQLKIARREIAALSQAYIAMLTNQATGLIDDPDHVLIAQADRDMLNGFDAAIAKAEGQP